MSPLTLFSLFAVFILGSIWFYKKYISNYLVFPTVNYLGFILKSFAFFKSPKDIPLHSFIFQCAVEVCNQFRKEGLCLFWSFQPYLFIYDPDAFKVFAYEKSTVNKPYNFDLFKEFLLESLLTSGGNLWRKRRKMLNPVFYLPNLKAKVQMINRNATLLIESLQKHNTDVSSNIITFLKVCSLRNIYEFLTDMELDADDKNHEVEDAIESVNSGTEMISYRIFKPWLHPRCFLFLSTKGRWFLKVSKRAMQLAEAMTDRMKQTPLIKREENKEDINEIYRRSLRSFKELILDQYEKDPSFTAMDVQGELTGLIVAGYDTVSYAMMWTLFMIGHHPDVQQQIYEEVESLMGHSNELSYDNLQNLKYLDCVIKEALRIYPPVPLYGRRTVKDVQYGKYVVPKGTNIILFTYLAHRDPGMFPDPEKFDPGRFLNGNSDKKLLTFTFAEGVRNCIGKTFAMMELKIIIAHVIKNFQVTSMDRREDISLSWEIILAPVKPLRINLTPRQPVSVQV